MRNFTSLLWVLIVIVGCYAVSCFAGLLIFNGSDGPPANFSWHLNMKFAISQVLISYNTPRSFNGDGYSFRKISLSAKDVEDIHADKLPEIFFCKYKNNVNWQKGQILEGELKQKFQIMFPVCANEINAELIEFKGALRRGDCYYAYEASPVEGDEPVVFLNIIFYLIDIDNKILYIVNCDT